MSIVLESPGCPEPSQRPPVARDNAPAFNEARALPELAPCGEMVGGLNRRRRESSFDALARSSSGDELDLGAGELGLGGTAAVGLVDACTFLCDRCKRKRCEIRNYAESCITFISGSWNFVRSTRPSLICRATQPLSEGTFPPNAPATRGSRFAPARLSPRSG